ncbi:MAG: hypothetical protein V1720_02595 [bacterium]
MLNRSFWPKAIILFTLIFISSCDIKNPIEGVAVLLNQAPIETAVTVEFIDSKTNSQIGVGQPTEIIIDVEGPDKDKIVNMQSQSVSSFTTTMGVINFSVASTTSPSKNDPVEIVLIAHAVGYLDAIQSITINSIGGSSFSVNMTNREEPPAGGCVNYGIAVPSNLGKITSNFNATSCNQNGSTTLASIEIAEGTNITDKSNQKLTGNLALQISYFDTESEGSTNSFPGGLSAKFIKNSSVVKNGIFTTVGFADFEITNENGAKAKYFDKNAVLKMNIAPGAINPQTGNPIKVGDLIPIWSLGESDGIWKFENEAEVEQVAGEPNYSVFIETGHLSWWNMGWVNEDICEVGSTLNFSGNFSSLRIRVKRADNNAVILPRKILTSTDASVTLTYVPAGIPAIVEVYNNLECDDTPAKTFEIPNLCANEYNFEVDLGGINVSVIVDAICTDRNPVLKIRPNVNIYIQNDCSELILIGKMENGQILLKALELNKTYVFAVEYEDQWYTEPALVTQSDYKIDYELPIEVCDDY